MALLHNNRSEEVISIIAEAKSKNHKCSFRGSKGDSYDYILEWCKRNTKNLLLHYRYNSLNKLIKWYKEKW